MGIEDETLRPRRPVVFAARASVAAASELAAIAAPTAGEVVDGGGWPTCAFPAPSRAARIAAPTAAEAVAGAPTPVVDLTVARAERAASEPRAARVARWATANPVGIAVAASVTLMVALSVSFGGGAESAREAVLTAHPSIARAIDGGRVEPRVATPEASAETTVAPPQTAPPTTPPAPAPTAAPAPPPPAVPPVTGGVPAPIPAPEARLLAGVKDKLHKVLGGPHGTDISYPQCDRDLPVDRHFAIVGVTGGRPFKPNPCLAKQWQWADAHGAASVYVNVANGQPLDETHSYVYGMQTIDYALDYARSQGVDGLPFVWLDVETLNSWNKTNKRVNAQVIRGAIDRLHQNGIAAGVYSTAYQWNLIAGDYRPGVPVWYATGANDGSRAPEKCADRWSFTGGPVYLVQYVYENLDRNVTCASVVPNSARAFKLR